MVKSDIWWYNKNIKKGSGAATSKNAALQIY